ncbi:lysophospholipid acyltransferase family protein [Litchfieldia salsa]|uniref:1-acyl-sn-glycerol-3-phosphate acyltransferase n=1 Tax=Litchfieldia salsa TaxID=930152 RepID=A0A1H0WFM2_9BACI|nr:lysophospholipid acyltransferase family protein [Litchfieldia salsa]SDP89457.1 1-acyl-sn-glycerol-3-phosphate acyltransferase [Litchfieldia salsa]
MSFYIFARETVRTLLKPFYRIEVIGQENVPKNDPVIICSNHIDNLDPPVVGITVERPVHFMAKEELFKVPVLGKLISKTNAFPVKRGMSDREALRKAMKILKDNEVLGLFPEGTRSKDGKLGKGLAGAGFFALRSNAVVIPCAIIGPYKIFGKIKVVYGQPIEMDHLRQEKASAETVTEHIMAGIQQLLEKNI